MSEKHVCIYGQKCWCGASLKHRELNRRSRVAGVGGKAGWPIWSDAAAVLPSQIPEAQAELQRAGVNAEFNRNGQPKFTDPSHRKACLKAMRLFDRSSFS